LNTSIIVALVGGILALLNTLLLLTVNDLRQRIVRLEDHLMKPAPTWDGQEDRRTPAAARGILR